MSITGESLPVEPESPQYFAERWGEFMEEVLSAQPPEVIPTARAFFYAGAVALYDLLALPPCEDVEAMVHKELVAYVTEEWEDPSPA